LTGGLFTSMTAIDRIFDRVTWADILIFLWSEWDQLIH